MTLTRERLVLIGVVVVAALAGLLIELAVVTDRERIERVIGEMAEAAARADVPRLFAYVSEDYSDRDISRDALRVLTDAVFNHYGPIRVSVRRMSVNVVQDTAAVELSVWAEDGAGALYGSSSWALEMAREPDGAWRVTRAVPLRIGGTELDGWRGFHEVTGF